MAYECLVADELPLPIATLTHKPNSSTAVNAPHIRLSFILRVLDRYHCQGEYVVSGAVVAGSCDSAFVIAFDSSSIVGRKFSF